MRKYFIIVWLLFHGYCCFSQKDSIYAKIEITSFFFEGHRDFIDTSIMITLEKFGRTDIVELGKVDSTEVGFQLELLKSYLGEKKIIINGIALFTKINGKWEMHSNPIYQFSVCKIISNRKLVSQKDVGNASLTIQDLQIDYNQVFYIIK